MTEVKQHCCESCQYYWTCELKWYRGERGEENICCTLCRYYQACFDKANKGKKKEAAK